MSYLRGFHRHIGIGHRITLCFMDIGIPIYPVGESISATWKLNKPFILSSRTNTLLVCIHHVGICFPTTIGNALQDILVAFRIINSSSPIKHPWSFLTPQRALVALQFLAFCFNSLPHHVWRRAFSVEALPPDRSALKNSTESDKQEKKQRHKQKKLVDA